MLILHAAREVVEANGFDETLDSVQDRVDEIESLHRTRELTVSANPNGLTFRGTDLCVGHITVQGHRQR